MTTMTKPGVPFGKGRRGFARGSFQALVLHIPVTAVPGNHSASSDSCILLALESLDNFNNERTNMLSVETGHE